MRLQSTFAYQIFEKNMNTMTTPPDIYQRYTMPKYRK